MACANDGNHMIVDLTIQNYRSIKDEQTLSLFVEHPKSHMAGHVAFPTGDKIGVLRSAGIYGANASGKSNVLLAIEALRYLASDMELKEDANIPCYEPYRLSNASREAPVKFAIEFVNTDGLRYFYSISFTRNAVLEESLDFYPSRQKANIFKRVAADTWETISFGGLYKGGTKRIPFFRNASYLSTAGNYAGSSELIRSVSQYFRNTVKHIGSKEDVYTAEFLDDENLMAKAARFLCYVDTGISAIQLRKNVIKNPKFLEDFPKEIREQIMERTKRTFLFAHKTEAGTQEFFTQGLESEGTQKLFSILPILLRAFENGNVLVLDELDNSFHPHIAELLIRLFNDPQVNTNNAQLIFTTHNMHLMSPDSMRRDQIWFVGKIDGASQLYSLDDFDKEKVKANSPYGLWYNEGRFGALPSINYGKISELLSSSAPHATPETLIAGRAAKKHSAGIPDAKT
jgi:AAA15 family ATPase/GTPase